jgi:hypothetical protein
MQTFEQDGQLSMQLLPDRSFAGRAAECGILDFRNSRTTANGT